VDYPEYVERLKQEYARLLNMQLDQLNAFMNKFEAVLQENDATENDAAIRLYVLGEGVN
jgi:hypothetical protein